LHVGERFGDICFRSRSMGDSAQSVSASSSDQQSNREGQRVRAESGRSSKLGRSTTNMPRLRAGSEMREWIGKGEAH